MGEFVDVFGQYTIPPTESSFSSIVIAPSTSASLAWPSEFSGQIPDEYVVSSIIHVSCGAGSILRLPPADGASVGQDILIRNVGAATLDIVDAEETSLFTLLSGSARLVYVTSNTDPSGTWGAFTYGTGTSGADAIALAGEGLRASSNKLQTNVPVRVVTANTSVLTSDRSHLFDVISGTVTITLPAKTTITSGFFIWVRNSAAGAISVATPDSTSIDGTVGFQMSPNESAAFIYSGAEWVTVGYGRSVEFSFSEIVVNAAAGNVSLTSGQVSGRMIRVAGTATSGFTITLPAIDNIYFVSTGAGLGAFSAEFTTGLGAAVTLPANQATVLYCDGTNVSIAITTTVSSELSLSDGSATAPTIFYSLDPDTGFYRSGDGEISFTSNGVQSLVFGPGGLDIGVAASNVSFAPVGTVVATDVQAAIAEIDTEKQPGTASLTFLSTAGTTAEDVRTYLELGTASLQASPGSDLVGTTSVQTVSNKTLVNYVEPVFTVTGTTPALSPADGGIQTWALSANSAPTEGTWDSGQSMTLMVNSSLGNSVNWSAVGVVWVGGAAPLIAISGYTVLSLWKVGTTVYGLIVGDVA